MHGLDGDPRLCDHTLYTHAGPEIGVAATKTFTSQVVSLYLLALHLAQRLGRISPEETRERLEDLAKARRTWMEQTLEIADPLIMDVAREFHLVGNFLFLGRGHLYPIALEGALKLKELSYIHAEGYPAGEMKHGPDRAHRRPHAARRARARQPSVREDPEQHPGGQGLAAPASSR